jgi:hypothetical protein
MEWSSAKDKSDADILFVVIFFSFLPGRLRAWKIQTIWVDEVEPIVF